MRFSHSLSGINRVRCNLCSFNSSWHSQSLKLNIHFKFSLFKHSRLWIQSFHALESPGFYVSFVCFPFFLKWIPLNSLDVNLLSKIKRLKFFHLVSADVNDFYIPRNGILVLRDLYLYVIHIIFVKN